MPPGRFYATRAGGGLAERRPSMTRPHLTAAEGLARLPGPEGERFVELFRHGTLSVELYAPRGTDPQEPHTRDEVYAVVQGSGWFRNGNDRHRFGTGDVLFVPAGVVHRFEEFTPDMVVWVFFYGPEGGETDS
jgi:mannose-6-phosphate isomerase-like protein (cupin superfamily)